MDNEKNEKKSLSRKISSLLPSDLYEDLSFNEDSNADEFSELKVQFIKVGN